MKRSRLNTIPDESSRNIAACPLGVGGLSRRDAVQKLGGWVVYLGALGGISAVTAACAPASSTDNGAQGTPTPTPSGTPAGCGCNAATSGTNSNLKAADVALYAVAYNSASQLFICHDDTGFYCMDALCPHEQCDMGTQGSSGSGAGGFKSSDVHWGFKCNCHGSAFDENGKVQAGSATGQNLPHYQLAVDANGDFWVDWHKPVSATCRC